ncbi:MAG: hypothetical protein AAF212_06615 [Verrucomicrobiota bacterium]
MPILAEDLEKRLDHFYSPLDDWRKWIEIDHLGQRARFDREGPWIDLENSEVSRFAEILDKKTPHISLDPGHIGGTWGPMEGRSFKVSDGPIFQEGDAVLLTAQKVQSLLEPYDVRVSLVRDSAEPINSKRPADYMDTALEWATTRWPDLSPSSQEFNEHVEARANLLFYRSDEIRARSLIVNDDLRPDLVVCLHINASGWEDPAKPSLTTEHNLHILVHGNYTPGELSSLESRQELAQKIAHSTYPLERQASEVFLKVFRQTTGLPPYTYKRNNALKIDEDGYLWARNLAANRLYRPPVVFLEPYVANSEEGYARIAAGEYSGRKEVAGKMRLSLTEEYARATASSLIELLELQPK